MSQEARNVQRQKSVFLRQDGNDGGDASSAVKPEEFQEALRDSLYHLAGVEPNTMEAEALLSRHSQGVERNSNDKSLGLSRGSRTPSPFDMEQVNTNPNRRQKTSTQRLQRGNTTSPATTRVVSHQRTDMFTGNVVDEQQRDINIFAAESQSSNELDKALNRVREIPLEQYLSQERASKVRKAQDSRAAKKKKVAAQKSGVNLRRGSDENGTRHAMSNFQLTGWSDKDSNYKREKIKGQYKGIEKFKGLSNFMTRRYFAMRRHEMYPIEQRIQEKRRQARANRRRRARGLQVDEDDTISNWTQQDPEIKPLVPREEQYAARIALPHLQTLENAQMPTALSMKQSMIQKSQIAGMDRESVAMSGMLVKKNQRINTMNQYDLVPEVIYNSMEIKLRDLVNTLIAPTNYRQVELANQHQAMYLKTHQLDVRLRECQLGIKKQLNMKAEFEHVNSRMETMDLRFKKLEADMQNHFNTMEGKIERQAGNVRVLQADLKAQARFVQKKNDDTIKMQEIIGNFKDRLMEKYSVLADEYTEQFKRLEHKQVIQDDRIAQTARRIDQFMKEAQELKIAQVQDIKELEIAKEDVEALKTCYKFGPRLKVLENQAKSDLLAVTKRLDDILYQNQSNLKRTEALKLVYAISTDMVKKLVDPVSHNSGRKPTQQKPKLETEVQATLNLLEWQIKFNESKPFDEANVFKAMQSYIDSVNTDSRALRTQRFKIELQAQKIGRKVERSGSVPNELLKTDGLTKIEMPKVVKKVVNFDLDQNNYLNKQSSLNLNSIQKTASLNAKPSRSNLRKIRKILEPNRMRELTKLSKIKRSSSYIWTPKEKPTIDNLYSDPTSINLLQRLRTNLASSSNLSNQNLSSQRQLATQKQSSIQRQETTALKKVPVKVLPKREPPPPQAPKEPKIREPRKSRPAKDKSSSSHSRKQKKLKKIDVSSREDEDKAQVQSQTTEFDYKSSEPDQPPPAKVVADAVKPVASKPVTSAIQQQEFLETIGEEIKREGAKEDQRQHLQQQVQDQLRNNYNRSSQRDPESSSERSHTPLSGHSLHNKTQTNMGKAKKQKQNRQMSDSENLFSSDGEQEAEDDIASCFYDEFVTKDDYEEELETLKEQLKQEVIQEAREIINETTNEIVSAQIEIAQISMTEMLEKQLGESQEGMKVHMKQEVGVVHNIVDNLKNTILPENMRKIDVQLQESIKKQKEELNRCLDSVTGNIKEFKERVEFFETDVATTQTKFKRLVSDQEIFKNRVERIQKRTQEMVRVMRSEQLATSKIMSTLVELEFIQQSLDFQDEFDKTQMNLYGLNDLNMTMEEFISKSSEIASRKLRHEAMQLASELEKEQLRASLNDQFEMTDSGTYQAIKMNDDWMEGIAKDEQLKKQIHQAFKLACVYYKPSPVLYRGHKYNRRSLIEAKRQMLDSDWQLIMKFQPFKRMWGEESEVNFFDQFAQKLSILIKGSENGFDTAKFAADIANDTFVKIMEGTNIYDLKIKSDTNDDELMSSDTESPRMLAALKDGSVNQYLNLSSSLNMGIDATQSSIRHQGESQELHSHSKLQNSARNHQHYQQHEHIVEKIDNRNKVQQKNHQNSSPDHGQATNTIESRTRSMLNAIQGKSIFGAYEESIFSDVDKTNAIHRQSKKQSPRDEVKRPFNRSMQKINSVENSGIFSEFLHQPFWMNQSQVIYETNQQSQHSLQEPSVAATYVAPLTTKAARKISELRQPHITTSVKRKSASRNELKVSGQRANQTTLNIASQRDIELQFWRENPMVEMRPLIGKEQLKQSSLVNQGTGAMDREDGNVNMNEYDFVSSTKKSIGRQTQFSMSPWSRTAVKESQSKNRMKEAATSKQNLANLDMAVVGKNETLPVVKSSERVPVQNSRNFHESSLQRSQVIKPTTVNFPLNLPIQTINMSIQGSPRDGNHQPLLLNSASNHNKAPNSNSQSVLSLPQVKNITTGNNARVGSGFGNAEISFDNTQQLRGNLGSAAVSAQQKSYTNIQESKFKQNRNNQQTASGTGLNQMTEGVASASSLMWTPEDDLGSKMQAKLAAQQEKTADASTILNTQKLKDIARQKKQILQKQASADIPSSGGASGAPKSNV